MRVTYTKQELTITSDDSQEGEFIRRFSAGPGDGWEFARLGYGVSTKETGLTIGWLRKPYPPPVTLFSRIGNRIDSWLCWVVHRWQCLIYTLQRVVEAIKDE